MDWESAITAAKWFGGIVGGIATSVLAGYVVWWMTLPAEPEYAGRRVVRTQSLGIEFNQDGQRILLDPESQALVVKPRAFEIRHWESAKADDPALQVAVSADPQILALDPSELFAPGTGAADYAFGSGQLFAWDDDVRRHNYIVGTRFNTSTPDYRGFYVSAITDVEGGRNLLAERVPVYFVFQIDDAIDKAQMTFD
jgi:hypothetical protein